jgi:hypothetical protein
MKLKRAIIGQRAQNKKSMKDLILIDDQLAELASKRPGIGRIPSLTLTITWRFWRLFGE